jgi:hypothetical protein
VVVAEPVSDHVGGVVAASFLGAAAQQPLEGDVVADLQEKHRVERLADLLEHGVERLGLRHGPRKAVEHVAVLLREPPADELDHEVVRDEVTLGHDRRDLRPELGAFGDRRAEDVAGGDMRDVVGGGDPLRLRALARPLWA